MKSYDFHADLGISLFAQKEFENLEEAKEWFYGVGISLKNPEFEVFNIDFHYSEVEETP